jgi:hypothetical protein
LCKHIVFFKSASYCKTRFMKKQLLILFVFISAYSVDCFSQTINSGRPLTTMGKVEQTKLFYETAKVDAELELANYAASGEKMFRFGKEFQVNMNIMTQASKTILPSGDALYQFGISCPNALSVNVVFDKFQLAPGTRLFIADALSEKFIGAYTSLNNNANSMLGTELVHTSKIIIEVIEPKAVVGTSILNLSTIVSGFQDLNALAKSLNSSGNCHYDVNCPEGNLWLDQTHSVAMMVNGGGFCTGALVNNTSGTIIPYFLSANHCGTNPGGWVFRFRWESPAASAICGTGLNSTNGPETMNVNGGTLRAAWAGSDFALTELNTAPNPAWGIYYSGWNNVDAAVPSSVGIHHPDGDIKKICFENNNALTSSAWAGTPANSHWHVPGWDLGVTEPGSSGSPLFDNNHRVIGQLHGGASACGAGNLSDEYGKFSFSWTGNNTNTSRLSNWLDPSSTGATAIDGIDPIGPAPALDAALNNPQGVSGTFCQATVTPQVTITNSGTDALTSATINYGYDGVLNQTYPWIGSLNQFQTVTITLPTATLAGGNHTFDAEVVNPNGSADLNLANNTISSSFSTVVNGQTVTLDLNLDCWGSETSWELYDVSSVMIYSGSGYSNNNPVLVQQDFCLSSGCYDFKIIDGIGDGMSGCSVANGGNGSYSITYNGDIIAELLEADANFGTENIQNFCFSLGLDEFSLANSISVYPNPANESITVLTDGLKMMKVELMNLAGQIISSTEVSSTLVKVDVSSVSSGVYFVKVFSAEGTAVKQLIIK